MPPPAKSLSSSTINLDPDQPEKASNDFGLQDVAENTGQDNKEAAKKNQHTTDADALYDFMVTEIEKDEGGGVVWLKAEDLLRAPVSQGRLENILPLINTLSSKQLIRAAKTSSGRTGETTWTCRKREDAKRVLSMTNEEKMVFSNIEDTQEKGMWVRNLKQKTGLNATVVEKSLKKLESNKLVKGVKNVKHPMQKTYILYHIVPSDEITGGTFFDAGTLDQSMIDELSNIIVYHVQQNSWAKARAKPARRAHAPPVIDNQGQSKKRKRTTDIEDAVSPPRIRQRTTRRDDLETDTITHIAYPAGTREYPTTENVHLYISGTGILRDKGADMTVGDLQGVMDVLVWDNKLERVGDGYRTVRGVNPRQPGAFYNMEADHTTGVTPATGLIQSACWRCPVFDICDEGNGPINANTCVYFEDWLMN